MKTRLITLMLLMGLCFAGRAVAQESVGSLPFMDTGLSFEERARDLVGRLTLDEKISLLSYTSGEIPRLGIPVYNFGNEALHGVMRPGTATVFPQAIALAATWNPDLIHEAATAISDEARGKNNALGRLITDHACGLLTFWSPTINMARDPRWGRTPETYGEDPFLTSQIGLGFVTGLQGDDPRYIKVVSTPKHYTANNEEHNRMRCNAIMPERSLREYYLPAYKVLIQQGKAQSIMGAYNAVNGIPCNANKMLLTDILRAEWGFDGYVVTDCGALHNMVTDHKYAKSMLESAAFAINAGVDLECGGDQVFLKNLKIAVESGMVDEKTLDTAVFRVLRARFRLGMFDPVDMVPYNAIPGEVVGSPAHVALARRVSQESIVLLKNADVNGAHILPLDASKIKSIAVVGPNAGLVRFGDYSGSPANPPVTVVDGLRARARGSININFAEWVPLPAENYTFISDQNLRNGAEKGLRAEYFKGGDFEGAPATTRTDARIYIDTVNNPPDPAIPHGKFAVRWSGKLVPSVTGEHSISVHSEGRFRVILDGKTILQRKGKKKPKMKTGQALDLYEMDDYAKQRMSASALLEAGKEYEIVVEYAHVEGTAVCKLEWLPPPADMATARAAEMDMVKNSDVVIAVVGIGIEHEREGQDRTDLNLPYGQTEYVRQIMDLNPNTVVVLINGSPLGINWIQDNAPAIVEAWYPGEQGGNAVADVLFGDYNPGGRLPVTFLKSVEDLPAFDDYDVTHGRTYQYFKGQPLYPFGYGLSYTKFEYKNLKADKTTAAAGDTVTISIDITNTGARDGGEVAQLYVRPPETGEARPQKQLKGFQRIHLKKDETQTVTFTLKTDDLGFWNESDKAFKTDPGQYEIQVGASSGDIRASNTFSIK